MSMRPYEWWFKGQESVSPIGDHNVSLQPVTYSPVLLQEGKLLRLGGSLLHSRHFWSNMRANCTA